MISAPDGEASAACGTEPRGAVVTAVIPAHNEQSRIERTIRSVRNFVDEVLVIDDASSDDTAHVAAAAGAKVISLPQNVGYIGAIKTGFMHANGDIIVTIDADGEFSGDCIPPLLRPVIEGSAEMAQGHRNLQPRVSERILTWLAALRGPVGDSGTGLRAIRSELARALEIRGRCICGVLSLEALAKGARIAEVPVILQTTSKPRKIAWFHLSQFFLLLPWLFRKYPAPPPRN